MKLDGIVTNVTAFGAFVDIGVHQDGLVHVSQLADRFVKDPHQVVKVHQKVKVTVLAVDLERKRISLSMKKEPDKKPEVEPKKEGKGPAGKPPARKEKRNPPLLTTPLSKPSNGRSDGFVINPTAGGISDLSKVPFERGIHLAQSRRHSFFD